MPGKSQACPLMQPVQPPCRPSLADFRARRALTTRTRGSWRQRYPSSCVASCSRRSRNGRWLARIFLRADGKVNHSARSISGKASMRPLRGGHSIVKLLLRTWSTSNSPSRAKASTRFPPRWRICPRGRRVPVGTAPSSSPNSRLAAISASSLAASSPFGMDHAPRSRRRQKGPPGCTRRTASSPSLRRYIRIPALEGGIEDVSRLRETTSHNSCANPNKAADTRCT